MPKRSDIKKILLIGSGPIIISQACEFDYSGTQACKALREEGYEVVLINSNPATIMTDPEMADRTYIEPITPEAVAKIIARERPDALLPTLGGQTGLNTAVTLAESGVLKEYNVEMIGASLDVIHKAEDREKFRHAIEKIGLRMPRSGFARSMPEVMKIAEEIGFPLIIRASFTLGGTGSGVAYNREELIDIAKSGLDASMISEVMIEESVLGWKEYELEVMRDKADNVVIICSIENFDAMGVHTGESITVAPAQTLTDREYQTMRDAAIAIMREIGVETGGSNVQFAVHPQTGEMIVVEMNPRVSRSSALASKATGFPIAKIAAKLAVGYTLDEIPNDITRETMASFEPTIDYCVVKIPRWTFEKFPETEDFLTTSMKSVGETMAIGRTFKEALQKAVRSLEIGRFGFGQDLPEDRQEREALLKGKLIKPNSLRLFYIAEALKDGMTLNDVYDITKIDPWFLHQIQNILEAEDELKNSEPTPELLRAAKEMGFSDRALSAFWMKTEQEIRDWRKKEDIFPVYKLVDTCAAEFEAYTPYYYSTYEKENESRPSAKKKVAIIGGGPNRIGQGIEFDYCCVHASFALREEGIESIMINSNPETVSTDYDTSDKLFFEPVTLEDVLHIIQTEKPDGVIVQFGGQTPLNLARGLEAAGVPIVGTSPTSIDRAENRDRFQEIVHKLHLNQPENDTAMDVGQALVAAGRIGYPVLVRPSYVLGGRSMEIIYDPETLKSFMAKALLVSPGHPVLIDKFLEDAVEVDVDAISDGRTTVVAGIMEHIEEAGIHSGDSACVLPPLTLSRSLMDRIEEQTKMLAAELNVVGLMNIQYAVKDGTLYVLEVNPRASRTVPFVSKAIGVPLAKLATKVMLGKSLEELGFTKTIKPKHISVKEAVFPFNRFPEADVGLGPEMKSTGEVMGIDESFGLAFAKSQMAAGFRVSASGSVFISVHDDHKNRIVNVARLFDQLGYRILATSGTAKYLGQQGIGATVVNKVSEGRPHVIDYIKNGDIQMVINTSVGRKSSRDAYHIRRGALAYNILYTTTLAGARALAEAAKAMNHQDWNVCSLQEYHKK
ncbi:MAG TPA: carbamoyl-phosphate synthase large subunit [Smithellaceae bacterium]|mgnify:FL=1|nr:carbamoyl-phosphate synthase large subunit [Smithellaceae bacterium]HPL66693.1 carbamoyl-phosphate synthase large subunit [Smithellaceae bacterium]